MRDRDFGLANAMLHELERLHSRVFEDHSDVARRPLGPDAIVGDALIERRFRRWSAARLGAVGFVGEETGAGMSRPTADQSLLFVDPIDGTRRLIDGRDDYALTFALARQGRLAVGGISVPGRGRRWVTGECVKAPAAVRRPLLAVSSRLWTEDLLRRAKRTGLDVRPLNSTAGRLLQLAWGEISGVVKTVGWRDDHPRLWGCAAGLIACAAAGCEIWYARRSRMLCVTCPDLGERLKVSLELPLERMDLDQAYRLMWEAPEASILPR